MKQVKQTIRPHRQFSESFKKSIVAQYESGQSTVLELQEDLQISNQLIYRWIRKYSSYYKQGSRIIVEMKSQDQSNKELRARIKELEQIIGKKQIQIDYLEKLIEIGRKEFKVDLKKKGDTSPWTGSESTDKDTPGQWKTWAR